MAQWDARGDISVHIGAASLKRIVFELLQPKWNNYSTFNGQYFTITINDVVLRDKNHVRIVAPHSEVEDRDAIAAQFFKPRSNTVGSSVVFKAGQAIVVLQVKEEFYAEYAQWRNTEEERLLEDEETDLEVRILTNIGGRHDLISI